MFLSFAFFRNALLSVDDMRECVEAFVSGVEIEATKIPFGAAAVDLVSGKQLVLRHGSIVRAVMPVARFQDLFWTGKKRGSNLWS
jgi:predicted acylesterase/phospholipase RssA